MKIILDKVVGINSYPQYVELIHEPDNEYSNNCCATRVEFMGQKLGYISEKPSCFEYPTNEYINANNIRKARIASITLEFPEVKEKPTKKEINFCNSSVEFDIRAKCKKCDTLQPAQQLNTKFGTKYLIESCVKCKEKTWASESVTSMTDKTEDIPVISNY